MNKKISASAILSFGLLAFAFMPLFGCATDKATEEPAPQAPVTAAVAPAPVYYRLSDKPPPDPVEETKPVGEMSIHDTWRPGYWADDNGQFRWVPGTIMPKPDMTSIWSADHWEKRQYGWAFVAGYWQ